MTINFDLNKILNCKLEIIGLENDTNLYSESTDISNKQFMYTDTETINAIYKVDSKENETLKEILINTHILNSDNSIPDDETIYTFTNDGLYKVVHLIIPNLEWLLKYIDSGLSLYSFIYVTDGNKYYKYTTELAEVEIDEILEINPESNVNFSIDDIYTFSICNLKTCYYNVCRELLNKGCDKCTTSDSYSYKRDVLWMVINVIEYLLEKGAFFEALRILENVTGCTGFCSESEDNKKGGSCGCNSRSKE